MAASADDLKKLQVQMDRYLSMLTDELRLPEKAQMAMLRNAIRQVWMRHPVKLYVLLSAREPVLEGRAKWKYPCAICSPTEAVFMQSDVEVDHKDGNHSIGSLSEFKAFYEAILNVHPDDLQVVCKECHGIKSYAEKHDMTFEDAELEKMVIDYIKSFKNVNKLKAELLKEGYSQADITNGNTRRNAVRALFRKRLGR